MTRSCAGKQVDLRFSSSVNRGVCARVQEHLVDLTCVFTGRILINAFIFGWSWMSISCFLSDLPADINLVVYTESVVDDCNVWNASCLEDMKTFVVPQRGPRPSV